MNLRMELGGVIVAVLVLGAYYLLGAERHDSKVDLGVDLQPENKVLVASGQRLYGQYCAACHGANLEGQPNWRERKPNGRLPAPPHDETGHTWHHPDAVLFAITKYGPAAVVGDESYQSDMPAYDGILTDREILATLSYIKSRWPDHVRQRHDLMRSDGVRSPG
ncbi:MULTISPECIES: c-type cytochrome [Kordiimonas]|jgi:mono/diheme cytochrome c family protein|uniref:c-type cytochrome n=1 Tax=Kordiimonas TaxID=288021 RepID=UPI00257DACD3|nr:cytochrome c [Kordiimonas sp. UBA4487]